MDTFDIISSYCHSKRRLILLDYDGTLVGFNNDPLAAAPTPEVLSILEQLSADPQNTVVIISGRDHHTLENWLGHLQLSFAAEHGLFFRDPGHEWEVLTDISVSWKESVREVMNACTKQLPGSFIEEKTSALSWHSRAAADQIQAEAVSDQLISTLEPLVQSHGLRLMHGNKVVEVQPIGYTKGTAAKRYIAQASWDFVFAAGDDTTDEDLFKAAPSGAFTIKIGGGQTAARLQVATPADFLVLLKVLT